MTKTLTTHTDLAPAEETSEAGFSSSQESWVSGRPMMVRDELLPIRPVRTFNLETDNTYLSFVPVTCWVYIRVFSALIICDSLDAIKFILLH